MNIKRSVLIILFVNFITITYSQNQDAKILATIKASIFSELKMGIVSETTLRHYVSRELKVDKLESTGYLNILFYSIPPQVLSIDTILNGDIVKYNTPACFYTDDVCNLIVGINENNGRVYKLRGFHQNDFKELYESQSSWYAWKKITKINNRLINEYMTSFSVEGLDLDCLLRSLKKKGDLNCLKVFFYVSGHINK